MISDDTIAAIATPPGTGGIAILRISGPEARAVLGRLFTPETAFIPRHMHYGHCLDKAGKILDEVLAVFMPGPHSATGEDVAEIHCHGGTGITAALLESSLAAGARPAGPGEFTRRAFLNGRIDLTRAEAVAEIINAPTREGVRLAQAKLDGLLGKKIAELRASLDSMRAQVILAVDFPDEDAELLPRDSFFADLEGARSSLKQLLAGFKRARLWREGAKIVLAGKVNAGKSSLLNALLGRRRAIVSGTPGTTRDYIEEMVSLGGMPARIFDTAGLRAGADDVEAEGIRLSQNLAEDADVLVFVAGADAEISGEDLDFLLSVSGSLTNGRIIIVLNKTDLLPTAGALTREETIREIMRLVPKGDKAPRLAEILEKSRLFAVSALNGTGLDEMAGGIREAALAGEKDPAAEFGKTDLAPNIRQAALMESALAELDALAGMEDLPPELISVHLDAAAEQLDAVTGFAGTEELFDSIFSSFCIGK